ncbi:MAG: gamma-glutamylcyclotransferase family protein [Sedimenticola sp.]
MSELVFVYGTLRRGELNHHLMCGAEYCGDHVTLPRYRMIDLGAYPGVVEGGGTAITGEIYRVNGQQFRQLDRLEDYPRLYNRKLIPSPWGSAWIYIYRGVRNGRSVIPGGNWLGQQRPGSFSLY